MASWERRAVGSLLPWQKRPLGVWASTAFGERTFVLLVAAPSCRSLDLAPLPSINSEVTRLRDALTDGLLAGVPKSQVTELSGESATLAAIDSNLRRIAQQVGLEDMLLLFFSGHGTDQGFCAVDSAPNDPSSLVTPRILADALGNLRARGVLAVFDCCQSAAFLEQSPAFLQALSGCAFRSVICSARRDQEAWHLGTEYGTLFSSRLTLALEGGIESVRGPRGSIYLSDLTRDLVDHVTSRSRSIGLAQDPVVFTVTSADPVLFVLRRHALDTVSIREERLPVGEIRRRVRRTLVVAGAALSLFIGLHYAYLEQHRFVRRTNEGLSIYAGSPELNGVWSVLFPRLVWSISPPPLDAIRSDSPLSLPGGILHFNSSTPWLKAMADHMTPRGVILLRLTFGDRAALKTELIQAFNAGDRDGVTAIAELAGEEDLALLRRALEEGHLEVIPALAALDPSPSPLLEAHWNTPNAQSWHVEVLHRLPRKRSPTEEVVARKLLLPSAEGPDAVHTIFWYALGRGISLTTVDLMQIFDLNMRSQSTLYPDIFRDIGRYSAITGNGEFLKAVAERASDPSISEQVRFSLSQVLASVPPRAVTGRSLVPCLASAAATDQTHLKGFLVHLAALHCDTLEPTFAEAFAGNDFIVGRARAKAGNRAQAIDLLTRQLKATGPSGPFDQLNAAELLAEIGATEASADVVIELRRSFDDVTPAAPDLQVGLLRAARKLGADPDFLLSDLQRSTITQPARLSAFRWLLASHPDKLKTLPMQLSPIEPLVMAQAGWNRTELREYLKRAPSDDARLGLLAAAGELEDVAELLSDPSVTIRMNASFNIVGNANAKKIIERAKSVTAARPWRVPEIAIAERGLESFEMMAHEIEALQLWARESMMHFRETRQLMFSQPGGLGAPELVRIRLNLP